MSGSVKPTFGLSIIPLLLGIVLLINNCRSGDDPSGRSYSDSTEMNENQYIGRESCKECHEREYNLFQGSDHDMAMDNASDETVLGDFNDASITLHGVSSRFFRQDGKFIVNTEGADGGLQDFEIKYVFGVRPLQQYLIEFPGGTFQMLPLCWDTRPASEGGQRWYHIYDQEHISPDDILHWTHVTQNWNYMCSECHSTNVHKNFDAVTETYNTTWSEIDVSCEACHGPGQQHLEWARVVEQGGNPET